MKTFMHLLLLPFVLTAFGLRLALVLSKEIGCLLAICVLVLANGIASSLFDISIIEGPKAKKGPMVRTVCALLPGRSEVPSD